MKHNRIRKLLSAVLTVLMLLGVFTVSFTAAAAGTLSVSVSQNTAQSGNLKTGVTASAAGASSFRWEVLSKPAGAVAAFGDPASASTVLYTSAAGSYTLRCTAGAGSSSGSAQLTVAVTGAQVAGSGEDVAPGASVSSDYTSSWENLNGVNNPDFEPASSNAGTGRGWGNWQQSAGSEHYIQYTWNSAVTVGSCDIYWYDDNGGLKVPASFRICYLNGSGQWVDLNVGYAGKLEKNRYNSVEFTPVTTTGLRLYQTVNASASGNGVYRWKTYSTAGSTTLPGITASTRVGELPALPAEVQSVSVLWEPVTAAMVAEPGTVTVNGVQPDGGKTAVCTLTVRPAPDGNAHYLLSLSDFQGSNYQNVASVLNAMDNAGVDGIERALLCGDYVDGSVGADGSDTSASTMTSRFNQLKGYINSHWSGVDFLAIQGNHDAKRWVTDSTLTATGAYEYTDYIVYAINEDDFPWWQGGYSSYSNTTTARNAVQNTTNNLQTYLNGRIAAGETRPVIIMTHVPMHWSSRSTTYNSWWSDNIYAYILFDVINSAAQNLDILFLFGHNHSEGYPEAYPSGGSVNLFQPGDTMRVPNGTTGASGNYTEKTVNFLYANAGYCGTVSSGFNPAPSTVSLITITSDKIAVQKYTTTGIYTGTNNYGELLRGQHGSAPAASLSITPASGTVTEGETAVFTAALSNAAALTYSWTVTGAAAIQSGSHSASCTVYGTQAGSATVCCAVTYNDGTEKTVSKSVSLTVNAAPLPPQPGTVTYEAISGLSDLQSGEEYLIVLYRYFGGTNTDSNNGYVFRSVNNGSLRSVTADGYATTTFAGGADLTGAVWYIAPYGSGYSIRNKDTGKYLTTGSIVANGGSAAAMTIVKGTCSGKTNYCIGSSSKSIRYSNSSGTFSFYNSSPANQVKSANACNIVIYKVVEAAAACAHTHTSTATVEASCTAAGSTTVTCADCGEVLSVTAIPAPGHNYTGAVTAPTCAARGYTVYTCVRCNDTYTGNYTDALGHDYTGVITRTPACTAAGVKTYTCSRCNDSYTETVPAAGHTAGAAVTENYVAPTCAAAGGYDTVVYCAVCNTELSRAASAVPATGHQYTAVSYGASCTVPGTTVYTCERCGDTYTETGTALGHDYRGVITTAPACTETGVKTFTCARCNDSYTETLPAAGHTAGAAVTENDIAPACTEEGGYDTVVYCAVCHAELSRTVHTVAAVGHDYNGAITLAPTCTAEGIRTCTCSRCNDSYTEPVPAAAHTVGAEVTENYIAPSCTAAGSYDSVVYCAVCGAELSRVSRGVAATGHNYTASVTEPTCTAQGFTVYTCAVCGDSYTASYTAAAGHSYTGTQSGSVITYTCVRCGYSYTEAVSAEYTKVSALTNGGKYLITVKSGSTYYVLTHTASNTVGRATVTVSNNKVTSAVTENMLWDYTGGKFCYTSGSTTRYLTASSSYFSYTLAIGTTGTAASLSGGRIKLGSYYIRYSGSSFSLNRSGSTVALFKEG